MAAQSPPGPLSISSPSDADIIMDALIAEALRGHCGLEEVPISPMERERADPRFEAAARALAVKLFSWSCHNCADVSSFPISEEMLRYSHAVLTAKLSEISRHGGMASEFLCGTLGLECADIVPPRVWKEGDALPPPPPTSRHPDLPCEDCGAPSEPHHGLLSFTLEPHELAAPLQRYHDVSVLQAIVTSSQEVLASLCVPALVSLSGSPIAAVAVAYDPCMLAHCDLSPPGPEAYILPGVAWVCV